MYATEVEFQQHLQPNEWDLEEESISSLEKRSWNTSKIELMFFNMCSESSSLIFGLEFNIHQMVLALKPVYGRLKTYLLKIPPI